ncbi:MAG: cyclic nucleotide-binding domain-containing protein [Candidatus Vogelbacteria bacterium]|nr:cyclic nucleotide-binding domain-containing protein [Candidatus Vogelbacteria bacterium]
MMSLEIKSVSYIWQKLLHDNHVPMDGIVVEVAPGYEKKIGDGLALLGFHGTIILIEQDQAAAEYIQKLYQKIMPKAKVLVVPKLLQDTQIGIDIPIKIDALVANHPFDDMAIALAMKGGQDRFFSLEVEDGMELSPQLKEFYDSISSKDYVHGILATILIWKQFIKKLKPGCFIASQYPSRKLGLKGLTKRQNSGIMAMEILKEYYESYLVDINSLVEQNLGQKSEPHWWIVARRPFKSVTNDLSEKPDAISRLGAEIFVPHQARQLQSDEFEIVYSNEEYFTSSGYGGDPERQSKKFAIVLVDDKCPQNTETIPVFADRQKDKTDIGLSGNQGSGRAVYFGKHHNVLGVGKTSLCTSTKPSHSTGRMEMIGSFRRVVLARWINHFSRRAIDHVAVLALKESKQFKWAINPIPLTLLVRVDDGALDRASHVEYSPSIIIDFDKILTEYAQLDAEFFAYRYMLGAWSNGNYSLDGRIIDLETVSFVKCRGPYKTAASKHHQNFFGYEGHGFVLILKQLAEAKGLLVDAIEERFFEIRERHLAKCFLLLLGISETNSERSISKYLNETLELSAIFERLSKKISPKRVELDLFVGITDEDDPSLLDMSLLFRSLANLLTLPGREEAAFGLLMRKVAFKNINETTEYYPALTKDGTINMGEVFIKDTAVITYGQKDDFVFKVKKFIRDLFRLLDLLSAEGYLGEFTFWNDQLQITNQDLPVLNELNSKLFYLTEEYRTGRMTSRHLTDEIARLCNFPNYPIGDNFDLKNIPLLDYLRPSVTDLQIISENIITVDFKQGETIVKKGENADSLFILVHGSCGVLVDGKEIGRIDMRGAVIGEAVMLEENRKRTATVMAESATRLLKIGLNDLDRLAQNYPDLQRLLVNILIQRKLGISDQLRSLEIFIGIDVEDLRLFFADRAVLKKFSKGEVVLRQGLRSEGVYILLAGSVVLNQTEGEGDVESISLLDTPLTQGLFGERSFILDDGAICTVTANENSTFLFVSGVSFRDLLDRSPSLLQNCLKHISEYSQANQARGALIKELEKKI